jgi:hypothetical protein
MPARSDIRGYLARWIKFPSLFLSAVRGPPSFELLAKKTHAFYGSRNTLKNKLVHTRTNSSGEFRFVCRRARVIPLGGELPKN